MLSDKLGIGYFWDLKGWYSILFIVINQSELLCDFDKLFLAIKVFYIWNLLFLVANWFSKFKYH